MLLWNTQKELIWFETCNSIFEAADHFNEISTSDCCPNLSWKLFLFEESMEAAVRERNIKKMVSVEFGWTTLIYRQ